MQKSQEKSDQRLHSRIVRLIPIACCHNLPFAGQTLMLTKNAIQCFLFILLTFSRCIKVGLSYPKSTLLKILNLKVYQSGVYLRNMFFAFLILKISFFSVLLYYLNNMIILDRSMQLQTGYVFVVVLERINFELLLKQAKKNNLKKKISANLSLHQIWRNSYFYHTRLFTGRLPIVHFHIF